MELAEKLLTVTSDNPSERSNNVVLFAVEIAEISIRLLYHIQTLVE